MKTRVLASACLVVWIVSSCFTAAPRARQAATSGVAGIWVGHERQIEEHLRAAEVTSVEEIGTGVTRPRRAYVKPDEPFGSLVWKVLPPGRRGGYWESYKSEIAAYELDKLLEMRMVPPAVERSIRGETGAAILWLEGVASVKEKGGQVPTGAVWGKAIRKMQMFDNLIANRDRNAGNILIGQPGALILIDHSRAFATDKEIQKFERVDADLWDRMKQLTREDLNGALGRWLDDDAIDAIIERRNRMAALIDELVARKRAVLVLIR